jgi:hypothetical protein
VTALEQVRESGFEPLEFGLGRKVPRVGAEPVPVAPADVERLELALTMLLARGHVLDKNTLAQLAAPEREQRKPAAGVKSRPPVQIATFAA